MSAPRTRRRSRLEALLAFDADLLAATGDTVLAGVIGVDEVGRGSLVGPVVAAAVCFHRELTPEEAELLSDLDDSKASHLTHRKRVALSESLKSLCAWGIGEASQHEVETLNISRASLLASHRAVLALCGGFSQCALAASLVVLDGRMVIPGFDVRQQAVVKADSKSAAVAGASVIAKAYRDELMIALAQEYPGYDWEANVGYPTPGHQRALAELGVTPLHRRTYKAVREVMEGQRLLF